MPARLQLKDRDIGEVSVFKCVSHKRNVEKIAGLTVVDGIDANGKHELTASHNKGSFFNNK